VSGHIRDPGEGIGLAARVILHIAGLNHLSPNDVAGLEYTQQGMAAVFGVRQSSLVKVLKSLLAGDALSVERRVTTQLSGVPKGAPNAG
jgi:hypothetical protein